MVVDSPLGGSWPYKTLPLPLGVLLRQCRETEGKQLYMCRLSGDTTFVHTLHTCVLY